MRSTWRAKTGKWKPSMIRTGMKCICFAAPALRAQTDVSTSFFTVFCSSLKFHFDSWLEFQMTFLFLLFLSLYFFSLSSLPANVRQNVAKRKHISLYHSTLHLQAHQTSGWEWKSLQKSLRTILNLCRVSSFYFLLNCHTLTFTFLVVCLLYGKQQWCDDTKLSTEASSFLRAKVTEKVVHNKELWKSCFALDVALR